MSEMSRIIKALPGLRAPVFALREIFDYACRNRLDLLIFDDEILKSILQFPQRLSEILIAVALKWFPNGDGRVGPTGSQSPVGPSPLRPIALM